MDSLNELITAFRKFPGVGKKSAKRMAFYLVKQDSKYLSQLGEIISGLKKNLYTCEQCGNISHKNPCSICADPLRDRKTLCIVEDIESLAVFEDAGIYNGLYHILGRVSAADGAEAEKKKFAFLGKHIKQLGTQEIIIATGQKIEDDLEYYALLDFLKTTGVKNITRIAFGLPVGGSIEFADRMTLSTALAARRRVL